MRPSDAIDLKREAIREAATRFRVSNLRVFGSAATRMDREGSDLDVLVDPLPETTLFDLGGLQIELEDLLGIAVDVRTLGDFPETDRDAILAGAKPI